MEAKACAKPHKDIESLKRALIQAWDEITPEILAKIVDNFPKRLEQCIKAKERHFELLLFFVNKLYLKLFKCPVFCASPCNLFFLNIFLLSLTFRSR